jgi:hypothetical protein
MVSTTTSVAFSDRGATSHWSRRGIRPGRPRLLLSLSAAVTLMFSGQTCLAARQWTGVLTNWRVYLDNGVAYVVSPTLSGCVNSRAQMATSTVVYSATYERDLYSFVLSAFTSGKPLNIVVDTTETPCVVYGADTQ